MLLCFLGFYSTETKELKMCIECCNLNVNCSAFYNNFIGIPLYLAFKDSFVLQFK
jgi:hypothetical protein